MADKSKPNTPKAKRQANEAVAASSPGTKRKAPAPATAAEEPAASATPAAKRPRKLAVRVKEGGRTPAEDGSSTVLRRTHLEISVPAAALQGKTPPASKSHVRFDHHDANNDDDHDGDEKFFTPLERPSGSTAVLDGPPPGNRGQSSDDESESDDDAPPEAISSNAAAQQLKDQAKSAAKAAELVTASERLKRQRRDKLFKQQAKKRALDGAEPSLAPSSSSSAAPAPGAQAPALLPAEFLESDDEGGSDGAEPATAESGPRRPRKIKFETAERQAARQERRGPADLRDGDVVYRVAKPRADVRLAPRASKYAAHQKRLLLVRGRTPARKKGGFLLR